MWFYFGTVMRRSYTYSLTDFSKMSSKEIGTIIIDLENAFDRVSGKLLWNVLKEINVDIALINTIKERFDQNKSCIKIRTNLSRGFKISKELLERCSLSPTLFKIYLAVAL